MADNNPATQINRTQLEEQFGGYTPPPSPVEIPEIPFQGLDHTGMPGTDIADPSSMSALENSIFSKRNGDSKLMGGGVPRSLAEMKSNRYPYYTPGEFNNEDAYAQGQGWSSKMISGVGKGLLLTGTTFLQSTAGLVNGLARAWIDGRAASFYDNPMNRWVDEVNKKWEDKLPNYYKDVEKNAHWYSPDYFLTGNFFWDGIVKNLGFSAGTIASGMVFAAGLRALPFASKLFSIGKAAETLAATEKGLLTADKAAGSFGEIKSLSDKFLGQYNLLNPGGRALIAGLATTGEASFEAYQNLNQFRDTKIKEYRDGYVDKEGTFHQGKGYDPIGADLLAINKEAEGVGNYSMKLNIALLSATNYIQFPKILGSSYRAEKGQLNSITRKIGDVVEKEGKYIEAPTFGGKILSTLNKIRPYTFSTSEGFEEGAQYAIQTGTQDYYNKKYNGGAASFIDSLSEGVKETLGTDAGMQNVLIGGLSGSLMLARGRYRENNERGKNTTSAVEKFNKFRISDFTKDTIDSVNRGTTLQEEREEYLKDGNISDSKDREFDYIINYLAPRIKYGRFDLVRSEIENYRTLASTETGFAQLQAEGKVAEGDTREAYLERINSLEQTAENVKSLYQSLHLRFGSQVNEKGEPVYSSAVMDKMVYAASKVSDYDKRILQLTSKLIASGVNTDEIIKDILSEKNDKYNEAIAHIDDLKLVDGDPLKQDLLDMGKLTLRRNKLLQEYDNIKNNPKNHQEQEVLPPIVQNEEEPKKIIKIKTKKGEQEIEIGTEYFMARPREGDERMTTPRITILGENEDGTIRIQSSNGAIKNISKDTLLDYKLGKVSDTLSNKKAKFVLDNYNMVYENYLIKDKDGNPVKGVIEWSPKKDMLLFRYRDINGKIKTTYVKNSFFKAKEGYPHGILAPVGVLTKEQEASKKDVAESKEDSRIEANIAKRRVILEDLFNEIANKQRVTEKLIVDKQTELTNISKRLTELEKTLLNPSVDNRYKKVIHFKSELAKASAETLRLVKMQDQFEKELEDKQTEKEDLENTLAYIADMSQNIEELPVGSKEFLAELRENKNLMEEMILNTGIEIEGIQKIIKNVKDALDSAVKYLKDLIGQFQSKYPKTPTSIIPDQWIDFLKTNPNFLKIKPDFKDDLHRLEDMVAQVEDLDIIPNERTINKLSEKITSLEASMHDMEQELKAKKIILSRFEQVVKKDQEQKAEEKMMNLKAELLTKGLGTDKSGIQTVEFDRNYEPEAKKPIRIIGNSTTTTGDKPHAIRSYKFGVKLETFKNRDNIRGVYITHKNENQLIKGLIDHMIGNADPDAPIPVREDMILLVMVQVDENGKNPVLIGVNGQPLDINASDEDKVNSAIYQTLPLKDLQWSNKYGKNVSAFREGTAQEIIDRITQQYGDKRERILNVDNLSEIHKIKASFGFLQYEYEQHTDDKGNDIKTRVYTTRTAVEDADMIDDDQLEKGPVIRIPTTNDTTEKGLVSFKNPKGVIFLETENGLTKLQNRHHTKVEAENIYQAIYHLAKDMLEGDLTGSHSKNLFDYLRSVVYWGIPTDQQGNRKHAGYNSIFWEKDDKTGKFMLSMSGLGMNFLFTPSSLENHKTEIIQLLEGMYNNINSAMVRDMNETYHEVLSVNPDGTLKTRLWKTYQAYLLSNKFIAVDDKSPDNGVSRDKDIPLTTMARPLKNKEDTNREGVYFYTTDTTDIKIPVIAKVTSKNIKPGKLNIEEEVETEKTPATKEYVLDGETPNTFTIAGKSGKKLQIRFTASKTVNKNNYIGTITVLPDIEPSTDRKVVLTAIKKAEKAIAAKTGKEEREDKEVLKEMILKSIYPTQEPLKEDTVKDITEASINSEEGELENQEITIPDEYTNAETEEVIIPGDEERVIIESNGKDFKQEEWDKVEMFLKTAFPNLPFYRVKNVIQATGGRRAWGMFSKGAIYVYKNAEVGTAYHEVFEVVWKMFTNPAEQFSIIQEFKSRKGMFVDRPTGENIKYTDATPQQVKEQLAEEFRDYIQNKKIPNKPIKGRPFILKMFSDLADFIRKFFIGENAVSNTEKLFEKITSGYYKMNAPYAKALSYAQEGIIDIEDAFATPGSELREITDRERSEIVQEMTFLTLIDMIQTDKGLFTTVTDLNQEEFYKNLQSQILYVTGKDIREAKRKVNAKLITQEEADKTIIPREALMKNIIKDWDKIIEKHKEYILRYDIEFDENDNLQVTDENKVKESDNWDSTKIDNFRKMNSAMKLLLATLPKMDAQGNSILSSIGGKVLIPVSKTYIQLMNKLSGSVNPGDMIMRLRDMAEDDVNYRALYKRITKTSWEDKGVNLKGVKSVHSAQLLTIFWNTFNKLNPTVKNVYIYENGEVVVGDANLSTAASQRRSEYINSLVLKVKGGSNYFTYSDKDKAYIGNSAKVKTLNFDSLSSYMEFLNNLGIEFKTTELEKLSKTHPEMYEMFREATSGIKQSIAGAEKIMTLSGTVLRINNRLLELGIVRMVIDNPEFDSTFFNISGEHTQSYIGTNAMGSLYNFLSQLKSFTINTIANSEYRYLWTDVFSNYESSNMLQRMFTPKGEPKKGFKDLMKVGYVSGTSNEKNGKHKPSAKLSYKERLIQEINLIRKGWYLNLVPADSTTEWMLYMGNPISLKSIASGMDDINLIFKKYFISELKMARENRPVHYERDQKLSGQLRFFKDILGDIHDDIIADKSDPEEVYRRNEKKINTKIEKYFDTKVDTFEKLLETFGILTKHEGKFTIENTSAPVGMTESEKNREIKAIVVNFAINNIEMHKLIYGDPYQYYQELKRTKLFDSPRQTGIHHSPEMNAVYNDVWNEGYEKGDIGYTEFTQDYFKSATHDDVTGIIDLPNYKDFKETDGQGIIGMKAYRQFRIRNSTWTDNEEKQFRYDIAWEKRDKKITLSLREQAILELDNPGVDSAYTPIKPIVTGNRLNDKGGPNDINDVVVDKFSLYPLSYRVMKELNPTANILKLYNKMQRENIDYMVFQKSRVVGGRNPHATYNENGKGDFNDTPYTGDTVINIPFSIISTQSEVPSKNTNLTTRGSQVTKLVTMDYMEAGVPIDYELKNAKGNIVTNFNDRYKAWYAIKEDAQRELLSPLYKEIKENRHLLEEMMEVGFQDLLRRLGIKEENKEFIITNFSDVVKTLREEIMKREVNDNVSAALASFLKGTSVLESTPVGQQVRHILYSIADKEFISMKINGKMNVQITSALLESVRAERTTINGKTGYTSDFLNFYEDKDGKRVCEIAIKRWFKSDKTDDQLLNEWYDTDKDGHKTLTDEGRKILSSVAFRIPTQKQNSIDSFVIKQFLPAGFGDAVVIPAALVQKAGSDFDIDKLTIYLKNVYVYNGEVELIPYFGIGQQAIDKLTELVDKGNFLPKGLSEALDKYILNEQNTADKFMRDHSPEAELLRKLLGTDSLLSVEEMIRDFTKGIKFKDQIVNNLYKKSLENGYIQSMQNLISHPSNFDKLTEPNSAQQMKDISDEIVMKTTGERIDYDSPGMMLDIGFMSNLRHAFISGKYAIGIGAKSQVNHSLDQRQPIIIDTDRLSKSTPEDRFWLNNGEVKFEKFNQIEHKGRMVPTLSMIKNAAGNYISNIVSQFIDGFVDIAKGPWIIELGVKINTASTWLFLVKLGVPIKTVAYFMNQPIIRNYLDKISNAGYSWLFIDSYVDDMKELYNSGEDIESLRKDFMIPSEKRLGELVGKDKSKLTKQELTEQQLILLEFLKYAKMAEHLFMISQATDFDTANFNDPYLVGKKFEQLKRAQNSIISSVDDILVNSFIGKLAATIQKMREAMAKILKSDHKNVRSVVQKVLDPYVNMNDNDFLKISRKVVNDLFDWAIQTGDEHLNRYIETTLIKKGGIAKDVMKFVKEVKDDPTHILYGNEIINSIESVPSSKVTEGGINNMKITNKDNKVYDQNNIIYAFRELRDFLGEDNSLYEKIKLLAVLQSGLSSSAISFTSLLPYEDFEGIYNNTLSKIERVHNLEDFYTLGVFERNNWSDDDITPYLRAKSISYTTSQGDVRYVYNPSMEFLDEKVKSAVKSEKIPPVMTLSKHNREGNSNHIVFTWEKQEDILTDQEKKEANKGGIPFYKAVQQKKAQMRKEGDYSFIQRGLFRKVYYNDGVTPLDWTDKKGRDYFIYKAINAWGDSYRVNEFYDTDHQSVIDNGFIKVKDVDNNKIITLFRDDQNKGNITPNELINSWQNETNESQSKGTREYTPDNITSLKPNEVFVFGSNMGSSTGGTPTHGKGAALLARQKFGAIQGQAEGIQGHSYAIVTKKYWDKEKSSTLEEISKNIQNFIIYATNHSDKKFYVTKLGSSLAGYTIADIKGIFEKINNSPMSNIPENVILPKEYEVRDENNSMKLKDGKSYTHDQINSKMLEAMGYTSEESGKILKKTKYKNC